MKYIALSFWAVATSFSASTHAFELRCENDLAQVRRDSKATILQKCGQPFYTEMFCVPIGDSDVPTMYVVPNMPFYPIAPCRLYEDWYYNPGSGQLITILRFEGSGNILQSIRYGARIP